MGFHCFKRCSFYGTTVQHLYNVCVNMNISSSKDIFKNVIMVWSVEGFSFLVLQFYNFKYYHVYVFKLFIESFKWDSETSGFDSLFTVYKLENTHLICLSGIKMMHLYNNYDNRVNDVKLLWIICLQALNFMLTKDACCEEANVYEIKVSQADARISACYLRNKLALWKRSLVSVIDI